MVTARNSQALRDGASAPAWPHESDRASIGQDRDSAVDAKFHVPRMKQHAGMPSRTRTSAGVAAFTARVGAVRAELRRFGRLTRASGRGRKQQPFNRTRTS